MNTHTLNDLLWRLDPMGTCCNVNEGMKNEYWSQTRDIAGRLTQGEDARSAVMAVFDTWFWKDCLLAVHRKDALEYLVATLEY